MNSMYNNFGIGVIALNSVLSHTENCSIAKSTLIYPLISHQELLNHLSRKSTKISSIEKLIISKPNCFSNFNKRYYDSLRHSFNALQYMSDLNIIHILNNKLAIKSKLEYDSSMGERAEKIFNASENISKLLSASDELLFLNLRVQL